MNAIAQRINEASVIMEGTPHPELVALLRIAAEEIQRLQNLRDAGIASVWTGRRFYFKVMKSPPNTPLAMKQQDVATPLRRLRSRGTTEK
jgi:hypothetical protein